MFISRAFVLSEAWHRRRMRADRRGQRRIGVLTRVPALFGVARLGPLGGYPNSARPHTSRMRSLVVLMLAIVLGVAASATVGSVKAGAATLAVDVQVTTHQSSAAASITSPTF